MTATCFQIKIVPMPITIGQHLREAREERYLTLAKASEETRIRVVFLQALESDDYSVMPSAAQGRGFLRNYAEYLKINIDELIAEFQQQAPPPDEMSGPLPQVNLAETNVPSLSDSVGVQKPPPFWMLRLRSAQAWLARRRTTESAPEEESSEPTQAQGEVQTSPAVVMQPAEKDESPPVEAEQVVAGGEAKPSLLARVIALFRVRLAGAESESAIAEEAGGSGVEPEARQAEPTESADVIFAEIGRKLRERRELISLTIDEVERHTRMRATLVRAMEEGALDRLPSTVQTRGMLANYAAFLDLDADVILLRFADAVQARRRAKYSETPRENVQTQVETSMPLLRSFIAGDLIFGGVMITVILALAVWGIGRVLNLREQRLAESSAPSIVDVLAGTSLPTPTVDATFVPVGDAPIATGAAGQTTLEAPTPAANINVVIDIFAVERTFVRISVDGEVAFEGRLVPRETRVYQAEDQVEVLTGNAAALRISYNGRDLGLMGDVGEVVSRVYTIAGVVTPTATLPPTPTETLPATITRTPTTTLTPTVENTSAP